MSSSTASIKNQLRAMQKACLVKRYQLPASFDECMAYITGYRRTNVKIKDAIDFLMLAKKCADYCQALGDKDSLQLLMYAVVRRIYDKRPIVGLDCSLLNLLDLIIGDVAGIYRENKGAQAHDAAEVFKALLNYIELERVKGKFQEIKYQPPEDLIARTQKLKTEKAKALERAPDLWNNRFKVGQDLEASIPFTRGGGVYNVLDMKKGIMPGMQDDSGGLYAIYVTPEQRADRDAYYATRSRLYLDVPCSQSGKMTNKHLKSTNSNVYEALIEVEDLDKISEHRIEVQEVDYFKDKEYYFFGGKSTLQTLRIYSDSDDTAFWQRLDMINEICSTVEKSPVVRKELLTQDRLNSKFSAHINKLKQLCSDYKQHLAAYPDQEKQAIVDRLEGILVLNEGKPLIRELKLFADEMESKRANLCKGSSTFTAFMSDILSFIGRLISFNYLAPHCPWLFFKDSKGESLAHRADEVKDEVNSLFEEATKNIV